MINMWTVEREELRIVLVCMIMLSVSDCTLPEDGLFILRGPVFRFRGTLIISHLIRSALHTPAHSRGHDTPEDRASWLLRGLGKLWQHLELGTESLLSIAHYAMTEYGDVSREEFHCHPMLVDGWYLNHLDARQKSDFTILLLNGTAGILHKERGTYNGSEFDLRLVLRAILRLSYSTGKYNYALADATTFDFILNVLLSELDSALSLVDALLQAPLSWVYVFSVRFLDSGRFDSSPAPTYGIDIHAYGRCLVFKSPPHTPHTVVICRLVCTFGQLHRSCFDQVRRR
ncbi:hypothetical protein BC629DRAFT_1512183 [Irpex lacteus]|nr:hypothetical protein BC629DRAFT_1512183 [Irpex lacteus]